MTNEDIIRMAREALKEDDGEDYYAYTHQIIHWWGKEDEIVKFAQLIAAAERNRIWTQDHWTEYERSIVATEREACASIEVHLTTPDRDYTTMSPLDAYEAALMDAAIAFREAIRARGHG